MTNVHPLFVSIFRAYGVAPTEDEEEIMGTSTPAEERSTVPTGKSVVAPVKCCRCGVNPATESPHTCPYQADVNNNDEPHCDCCSDCQHECRMDI